LSGTEVSINVAGSVQSDSITGSTITMKNTGSTIVASDGTTAVLSESGGTVTLTADEANVGSNALVVDASGNVGIGTSSPSSDFHVSGGADSTIKNTASSGSSWFVGTNTSSYILHNESNTPMVFTTNGTERMRINSLGRIQHNTGGSEITTGGGAPQYSMNYSSNSGPGLRIQDTTAQNGNKFISFINAGTVCGNITSDGSTTSSYNETSDYRLKTNTRPMTGATERLKALNPINFEWISNGKRVDGFLAHEVQEVVPEAVTGEKDAVNEDGSINPQGIDKSKLVPLLTAALQEAITLIESQQSQIDALTARIEALENP
jgi:hypothetical protein